MKQETRKRNPNLRQFTLSNEAIDILDKFKERYGTIGSEVVNRALLLLGAKYHHKIVISYEIVSDDTTTTTTKPKSVYEKTVEEHNKRIEEITSKEPQIIYGEPKRDKKTIIYPDGKKEILDINDQVIF